MRKTRVLEVVAAPEAGRTRYVDQVVDASAGDLEYVYFSWLRALTGRFDIVHLHWPEKMLRARRPIVVLAKRVLIRLLLVKLRVTGTRIVRTLHNIDPHESGSAAERRLLQRLDEETDWFIRLNDATPLPVTGRGATTILHADYVEQYGHFPVGAPVPGRILHFGHMRPYKGIERLIEVFESAPDTRRSLRLVGETGDAALRHLIEAASRRDPRIEHVFGFLDDEELAQEIGGADVVALPYRNMHNSGALLLSLSVATPVLAPWSSVNEMVLREVGTDWLYLYRGDLTEAVLADALERSQASRSSRGQRPAMPNRRWQTVRAAHSSLFRMLAAQSRANLRARAAAPAGSSVQGADAAI